MLQCWWSQYSSRTGRSSFHSNRSSCFQIWRAWWNRRLLSKDIQTWGNHGDVGSRPDSGPWPVCSSDLAATLKRKQRDFVTRVYKTCIMKWKKYGNKTCRGCLQQEQLFQVFVFVHFAFLSSVSFLVNSHSVMHLTYTNSFTHYFMIFLQFHHQFCLQI